MCDNNNSIGKLRIAQLRQLVALSEAKSIDGAAEQMDIDSGTLSRGFDRIEQLLGFPVTIPRIGRNQNRQLNDKGHELSKIAKEFLFDFSTATQRKPTIRISSGGSIMAWLLSNRFESITKLWLTSAQKEFSDPTLQISVLANIGRNQNIVRRVENSELEFGIVRRDILQRSPLAHSDIGTLRYHLYVPRRILDSSIQNKLTAEQQRNTLSEYPIVTIGHGQSRLRLERALRIQGIKADIRLSYDAFPLIIRTLRRSAEDHTNNHPFIGIMPDIACFDLNELPEIVNVPLYLMKDYSRTMSLIWRKDYADNKQSWLKPDAIAELLKFPFK